MWLNVRYCFRIPARQHSFESADLLTGVPVPSAGAVPRRRRKQRAVSSVTQDTEVEPLTPDSRASLVSGDCLPQTVFLLVSALYYSRSENWPIARVHCPLTVHCSVLPLCDNKKTLATSRYEKTRRSWREEGYFVPSTAYVYKCECM